VADIAGKKIMVVEDDPDATETLRIVLEDEGCLVCCAENGDEALDKARSERPDLILLDIMMPSGTEGFHFVWNLRKEDEAEVRNTPIVVLTAIHDKTWVKFYPEKGDPVYKESEYLPVQAFLDKPASSGELVQKIEEVLTSQAESVRGKRQ